MLERSLDSKLAAFRDELIREITTEIKGKVLKTWKEGTDRFYNEARSIVSEYSRSPSIASEFSRSRSASKDFGQSLQKPKANEKFPPAEFLATPEVK